EFPGGGLQAVAALAIVVALLILRVDHVQPEAWFASEAGEVAQHRARHEWTDPVLVGRWWVDHDSLRMKGWGCQGAGGSPPGEEGRAGGCEPGARLVGGRRARTPIPAPLSRQHRPIPRGCGPGGRIVDRLLRRLKENNWSSWQVPEVLDWGPA